MERHYLDGKQWEYIIQTYLLKLKTFHLSMAFTPHRYNTIEEYVDRLLNSFWLDDHQWYVRCHWDETTDLNEFDSIVLTTLPDLTNCSSNVTDLTYHKSTCPDENIYSSYDHTDFLDLAYTQLFYLHPFVFPDIRHLSLKHPVNDKLWSIVPNLKNLRTLKFCNLHKLELNLYETKYKIISKIKHDSIRHLDFGNYIFNSEEFEILLNSQLGQQCEVLTLSIECLHDILELIDQLKNLRSLKIVSSCNNDILSVYSEDELNDCLTFHLPSTCDFRINYYSHMSYYFYIWIQ